MNETKKQLEERLALACESAHLSLSDSPKSLMAQVYNHVGYYQGFCAANEWEPDMIFVLKMLDLSHK